MEKVHQQRADHGPPARDSLTRSTGSIGFSTENQPARIVDGAGVVPSLVLTPSKILILQRTIGNRSTRTVLQAVSAASRAGVVQRTIAWKPDHEVPAFRSKEAFIGSLATDFAYLKADYDVDIRAELKLFVDEAEGQKGRPWHPRTLRQQIEANLLKKYPKKSRQLGEGQKTSIDAVEFEHYFISTFKTLLEARVTYRGPDPKNPNGQWIAGSQSYKTTNDSEHDHAENNLIKELNKLISLMNWQDDERGNRSIEIIINNSPCWKCAAQIYSWEFRDLFDSISIRFANLYDEGGYFTHATTLLRSGGVSMAVMSVMSELQPIVSGALDKYGERARKDLRVAAAFEKWKQETGKKYAYVDESKKGADVIQMMDLGQ